MKKFTIMILVTLVLFSACRISSDNELPYKGNGNGIELDDEIIDNGSSSEEPSDPAGIIIRIVMSGNVEGDSVISLSDYGKAGEEINLNYNLANIKQNNRIVFSGTSPAIEEVDGAGSGERKYVIAEDDAVEGVITINAVFTHTDKQLNTIAFADTSNEEIVYGDSFTKAITNTGSGSGAISYVSDDTSVATVNNFGMVTIHKAGTATITATKAADAVYEKAEAKYTLTVMRLQLTIAAPVVKSKIYDGTTTADVTIGALTNKVIGDTVNVTASANFNSADVANAKKITVVYTIDGVSADNYIKPADSVITGVISKAPGVAVNGNPSVLTKTASSITSSVVTAPGEQSVEYAIATTAAAPASGWQDGQFFGGLTPSTDYYLFARSKESDNYQAGAAKASSKITTEAPTITINISLTGNDTGDNVTVTPASGKAGEEITLNYTLASIKANNRLVFSGTTTPITAVNSAGNGTRKYVIKEEDAVQNIITINAAFSHAELVLDTIAFENTSNEEKVYGDAVFTKAITNTGFGSGKITYSSDNTGVATVNSTTGAVTIVKVGTAAITATKAADATFAQTTASYTLTVTKLQLTIANPTVTTTKVYKSGDTTAAVTAGALTNKVGNDTVNVSAAANYNSANVADANLITVVYTISGASADNYIKPVNYTIAGTITKAAGAATSSQSGGNVTVSSKTANTITVNTVNLSSTNPGNQTPEYAISTTNTAPTSGWQDGTTFTGLSANTDYYVFARAKENANYQAGAAKASEKITTNILTTTISFAAPLSENKVYGTNFSKTLSTTGSGTGAITYSSSDENIAAVNSSTGEVTPKKVGGPITITATKASDGTYAQATATYTLTITPLQLTISNPTLTTSKKYDGNTTAAVTKGTLSGVKSGDTVSVTAEANYVSADVGTGKTITVVYTLSGTGAGNYLAPPDYTVTNGVITKADGQSVSAPTVASKTSVSITVNAVTAPSGQTVEYAAATGTTAPSSGWTDSTTISGLTANTSYYIYARSKANDNYNAGTAERTSSQTKTDAASAAVTTVVNFESDSVNKTYDYTEGDNAPSSVKVVNDPVNSGKKSLQITTNGPNDKGYNQAAVIPVKLPYTVKDYQTVSFKFSLVSGNTGTNLDSKQIQVYIAKNKDTFKKWAFGNDSSAGNHFADNLIGAAPSSAVNFDSSYVGKWTDYSITITNPGNAIKDLTGDLYIAIGINCKTNAVYLFDDITFTPKSGFTPPPPPPTAPSTAPNPPSTGAVSSKNYRNMFTEFGYSSADVTAKVNNAWNKLFVSGTSDEKIYVESGSDMAYIYTADTDDVRSEGMSYGMMMCVQMNDQTRFNKLWKWAKTYMYNPTTNAGNNNRGYFAWQCNTNGSRKDQSPAPDGEAYFVTALLFASARWGDGTGDLEYGKWARQIIYDMVHRTPNNTVDPYGAPTMFDLTEKQVVFVPYGNSATHTDPSYHLPSFYEIWVLELENDLKNNKLSAWSSKSELETDIAFYKQATSTSRSFFQKTTNSTTGLGPDYAAFSGAATGGNHADFRFDAWRIAMNIGMDYAWWAKDSWQKDFANRIQAFFKSKGISTYKNQWKLDGTVIEGDHSPGLVGCNAVASLAATNVNAWEFIEDFWNIPMTTGKYRYYDGCLYMMCMLHLSGNFKAYLSTNTTPANSSSISPTTATFDKKSGATNYKDIAVTVTLNGNTFSNIKNGSTTLTGGGTDYSVSGTTYTIKKEYLAKQSVGTTTLTFNFSGGASPELVITITDSSNSTIDPTTATFDKKTGATDNKDIAVTMTLNGNSLSNIKNGNTTLTNNTDYSVSGSTVTIKKAYLAAQANGTVTLTFTFNGGSTTTQSIAITVKDTTGGTAGTTYNFATDNLPNGYPKYGGSGTISGEVTGGVLVVTKTGNYSTPKITLPFSITGNLSGYKSIKINVKGVSGDFGNKVLYAGIGSTNLGSVNNAPIPNGSFGDVTIPITNGGTNTGDLDISFWLDNTNAYVIEIKSIELIK